MTAKSGDRTAHWPAIEKKHGQPIDHWIGLFKAVPSGKYQDQIDLLRQEHGFSQAHANAVVMFARGSTTTKRFGTLDDYLKGADPTGAKTMRAIFAAIDKKFPDLELVIAWNQPMLKSGDGYVIGVTLTKSHILLAPWGDGVLASFEPRLTGLEMNKKTVRVPLDWKVDVKLLQDMAATRIAQLET
ncbi:MAG: DUF4287 domain-containing protein [Actinobacteria bacterium]|nr:DUF4287 domain-containing protein [Actinomycetota bacterium]